MEDEESALEEEAQQAAPEAVQTAAAVHRIARRAMRDLARWAAVIAAARDAGGVARTVRGCLNYLCHVRLAMWMMDVLLRRT